MVEGREGGTSAGDDAEPRERRLRPGVDPDGAAPPSGHGEGARDARPDPLEEPPREAPAPDEAAAPPGERKGLRGLASSGPLFMILATLAFTAMVASVKIARESMSAVELVFWRAAISTPLVMLTLRGVRLHITRKRAFAARLLLGLGAMSCFYAAAKELPLVDLNLITRLQPILIAIVAPFLLGPDEKAGRQTWISAIAGFAGCALVLSPSLRVGSLYGLVALAATFFSAGAHMSLRRVAAVDQGRAIVLWFHVGMALAALSALLATEGRVPLPPRELWPYVLGVGVLATLGQLLLTKAYSLDSAPKVAAASYAGVLFALVGDLIVFQLVPGPLQVFGGILIVGASLRLVLLRGRRRRAGSLPDEP